MSRVSDKTKETLEEKAESVVSGDSDDDDAEEPVRENTPDLYRNSSLGMYVHVLLTTEYVAYVY